MKDFLLYLVLLRSIAAAATAGGGRAIFQINECLD